MAALGVPGIDDGWVPFPQRLARVDVSHGPVVEPGFGQVGHGAGSVGVVVRVPSNVGVQKPDVETLS